MADVPTNGAEKRLQVSTDGNEMRSRVIKGGIILLYSVCVFIAARFYVQFHLSPLLLSVNLFLLSFAAPSPFLPRSFLSPLSAVVSDDGGNQSIRHCGGCVCVRVCMSSGTGWPPADVKEICHVSLSQQRTRLSGRTR